MEEFDQLLEHVYNGPRPQFMTYLNKCKILLNVSDYSDIIDVRIEKVVGQEIKCALHYLRKFGDVPDSKIFKKIRDANNSKEITKDLISEMKEWITQNERSHKIYDIIIMIIDDQIAQQRAKNISVNPDKIRDLEAEIAKHHDWELTKRQGHHAICLWSDGEIDSTKAGHCYDQRSRFGVRPPLLIYPTLILPIHGGKFSYAVIPNEKLAIELRNKMASLVNIGLI